MRYFFFAVFSLVAFDGRAYGLRPTTFGGPYRLRPFRSRTTRVGASPRDFGGGTRPGGPRRPPAIPHMTSTASVPSGAGGTVRIEIPGGSSEDTEKWLEWLETGERKRRPAGDESAVEPRKGAKQPKTSASASASASSPVPPTIISRESAKREDLSRSERYSAQDWRHNIASLPDSTILREVRNPLIWMSSWAAVVSVVHRYLRRSYPRVADHMTIPGAPHSLLVSAIGLLLVFRTNSAYQRFVEGRKIWEDISSTARDLTRMIKMYEEQIGKEKRIRVQRLLAAFPYLLRHRIKPNLLMRRLKGTNFERNEHSLLLYDDAVMTDYDLELATSAASEESDGKSRRNTRPLYWVDRRTLPWRLLPKQALEACARAQNRPLWVCDRMAKEIQTVPDQPNWTSRERLTTIAMLNKMSHCIGGCERIHQTVVPLNYARHSLRSLTIWLIGLPLALVKDLGLATAPVVWVVAWCLFGVYQIGYSIEDPFQGTLRLSILCDSIRKDVIGDEFFRDTAFIDPEKFYRKEEKEAVAAVAAASASGAAQGGGHTGNQYDTGFLDDEDGEEGEGQEETQPEGASAGHSRKVL